MAHQHFHGLLACLERRSPGVRDKYPRPQAKPFQRRGITVAPLQCAEVARNAVLYERNAAIAFGMQIAGCANAHVVVGKTNLDRAAVRLMVPGFNHRDVGLLDHLLSRRAVEATGQHQGRRRPAQKRPHGAFFLLGGKVAGGQQQLETMLAQGVAEALNGVGEDRPGDVGDHHRHHLAARRRQAACHQVGHIAQRIDHRRDAFAQFGRDLLRLIEIARHGDGRHPRLACHGGDRHPAGASAFACRRFFVSHARITSHKIKRNIKLVFQYWTIYLPIPDTGDVSANNDGLSATRHRECPDPV
ncbi:hypothetical protein ALQ24_03335 [Pseudomonas syringae pv. antirrhini]|nr:hypothetical protein ALQ24_03335 [Pseudomonas syringae pv. antirrhini]